MSKVAGRKTFRFGLKTILLGTASFGILLGLIVHAYRPCLDVDIVYGGSGLVDGNWHFIGSSERTLMSRELKNLIKDACEDNPPLKAKWEEASIRCNHLSLYYGDGDSILDVSYSFVGYVVKNSESPFKFVFRSQIEQLEQTAHKENRKIEQVLNSYVLDRLAKKMK